MIAVNDNMQRSRGLVAIRSATAARMWTMDFLMARRDGASAAFKTANLGDFLGKPGALNASPRHCLMLHNGRLTGHMSWDFGRAKLPRRSSKETGDERR